jgi:uncharacterized membrane protein (DUF485 family)
MIIWMPEQHKVPKKKKSQRRSFMLKETLTLILVYVLLISLNITVLSLLTQN